MKKIAIPIVGCLVLMAGCQQAEEFTSANEKLRMSIEASVGEDGKIAGRSVMGNDGTMSFQENDAIGLSVNDGDFVKWTLTGDVWQQNPETMYWEDKTSNHVFCAFYPYDSEATLQNVPMPDLSTQQGKKDELGKYDFLVATKDQTYGTDGTVSFSEKDAFSHELSLITITLKGEGDLVASTIQKISLKGTDIVTNYAYSFEKSEAEPASDETGNVNELVVTMPDDFTLTKEGHTFYFVLNSGTVDLENVTLEIGYIKGETEYVAKLEGMGASGESKNRFEKGKQYNYALKVVGGVISISGNEIQEWGDGFTIGDIIIDRQEPQKDSES